MRSSVQVGREIIYLLGNFTEAQLMALAINRRIRIANLEAENLDSPFYG